MSVKAEGEAKTFEAFSDKARTVVAHVLSSGAKRILLDDRALAVALDTHDITRAADLLEKSNFQALGLRLASLCRPEDRCVYDSIETIYRNRSINFRRFDDKQTAVEWLRK